MRALLQRVSSAGVTVGDSYKSETGAGLCVFLGVAPDDTDKDIVWLAEKIANLRIFEDGEGKMNRSLLDEGGDALVISQFTLFADCRKGRRPSWGAAAEPDFANMMYEKFIKEIESKGIRTGRGIFQANMLVSINNDGPVTIMIDTKEC